MTDATAETLDLSRLPSPTLVTLDYEASLAARKADLVAKAAAVGIDYDVTGLESEPGVIVEEVDAGREMIALQAINDAGLANMLAHSTGPDLDNLAAIYGLGLPVKLERAVVGTDLSGNPIMEGDERFRRRIQLAPEGKAQGSPAYYVFHALTAVPTLADATAVSPAPGEVVVTVMGSGDNPAPSTAEVDAARAALFADNIKPLTDILTVQAADVITIDLTAQLQLYSGPDATTVLADARAAEIAFLAKNKRLGRDLILYAWVGRLQRDSVYAVRPLGPLADIPATPYQVVYVHSLNLTFTGVGA